MKHEELSKEALAHRFGVDVRTITNWVQAGMPQRKKSGKPVYSWPECRAWREQQIRDDARATRHADGDEDRKARVAEARAAQVILEAEREAFEFAKERGQYVTLDFMAGEFSRVATALRGRLLSLPAAWADRLGACTTTVDRQLALQEAVNELLPILGELADTDPAPAADGEETAA